MNQLAKLAARESVGAYTVKSSGRKSAYGFARLGLTLSGVFAGVLYMQSLDAQRYHKKVAERMQE